MAVLVLVGPAQSVEAQGPAAVGLVQRTASRHSARLDGHEVAGRLHIRRGTAAGTGAIIGLVVGAAVGLLATKTPGPGGGDGLGYEAVIGMAVVGAAVGALLGHIISDRG